MTTTTKFNTAFIQTLTLEQARAWEAAGEKFMHVVDHFDEVLLASGSASESRVAKVEERFEELLKEAAEVALKEAAEATDMAAGNALTPEIEALEAELGDGWDDVKGPRLYNLRRDRAALLAPSVARPLPEGFSGFSSVVKVQPEALKVGDLQYYYGFVGRIVEINVYPQRDTPDRPVYVTKMVYEGGDLSRFLYFRESINNGCHRGHRAGAQGNNLADWWIVKEAN